MPQRAGRDSEPVGGLAGALDDPPALLEHAHDVRSLGLLERPGRRRGGRVGDPGPDGWFGRLRNRRLGRHRLVELWLGRHRHERLGRHRVVGW
jgi:hypothetical protein